MTLTLTPTQKKNTHGLLSVVRCPLSLNKQK